MTTAVVEVRAGCTAPRHDTASAYKKNGCRCEPARRAEIARKAKYETRRGRRTRTDAGSLLALTRAGLPEWRTDPRRPCARIDPDLMFAETSPYVDIATNVCKPCPRRAECLEWSIAHAIPYGVWGAVPADARRPMIRRRHREQVPA